MLRTLFLAGVAAAAAGAASPAPSPQPPAASDDDAPTCDRNRLLPYDKRLEFHDSALDGADFDLAKYRGCGPCRTEQPLVVAAAAKYRERGLRTIGLFAREEDNAVRQNRTRFKIDYPLVRDGNGILTANLQGSGGRSVFPAHLFIAGTGLLYCYEVGGLDADTIDTTIAHLLATTASPLPPDPEPVKTPALSLLDPARNSKSSHRA